MASRKPQLTDILLGEAPEPYAAILMTRWAGMAATKKIAVCEEQKLKKILPGPLLDEAKCIGHPKEAQDDELERAKKIAKENGFCAWLPLGEEGVFGGLWNLGAYLDVGIEVQLDKIPIRQETVELCEYIDCNPYMADATGAALIVSVKGDFLAEQLLKKGIPAAVIGRVMPGRDRVIVNGEEKRFLNRSQKCD